MLRVSLTTVWLALLGGGLSAQPVELADLIAAARDVDIVVLGEVHDNPEHHRNQAAVVAALQPGALVFEMIPQASEDDVNRLRAGGASRDEIAEALAWDESGWPDFAGYAEILEAAPEARIFGGGQPMTLPAMEMLPEVMVSSPAIMRSKVDLPQPEGPSSTVNEPSGMSSDTPFTASTPPA
jgi:hypothetical protein